MPEACIVHKFHAGRRPQHFLYFFPLPQGQGSLRPTLYSLERAGTGAGMDFEVELGMLEPRDAEGLFHRPQYEMLSAVSVIGRNLSACSRRHVARSRLASCSNSSRVVANGSTTPCLKRGRISSINSAGWSSNTASTSWVQVIPSSLGKRLSAK